MITQPPKFTTHTGVLAFHTTSLIWVVKHC